MEREVIPPGRSFPSAFGRRVSVCLLHCSETQPDVEERKQPNIQNNKSLNKNYIIRLCDIQKYAAVLDFLNQRFMN